MATLQRQIAEKFLAKLSESPEFDPKKIEEIRNLLTDGKKIKAEDLVRIFSAPLGGDIK
jgi:hypothetical protein